MPRPIRPTPSVKRVDKRHVCVGLYVLTRAEAFDLCARLLTALSECDPLPRRAKETA